MLNRFVEMEVQVQSICMFEFDIDYKIPLKIFVPSYTTTNGEWLCCSEISLKYWITLNESKLRTFRSGLQIIEISRLCFHSTSSYGALRMNWHLI